MRPTVLVSGPPATRSGYGAHARDLIHALIEMDRFDTDYGPQDEYLFDRERGFENRIFGIDPNYFRGGIASLLR